MPLRLRREDRIPEQYPRSAFGEMSVATPSPKIQLVFPYNFNTDLVTGSTTTSGTIGVSNNMCLLGTGTDTDGSAKLKSIATLKYNPGQGAMARFTSVFNLPAPLSCQYVGIIDETDGFAFGYTGTQFSILHRSGSTETWYAQSAWSNDPLNGNGPSGMALDPAKGNVYQIRYQWLGFGEIGFFVEDDERGTFQKVHRIKYANRHTETSITNPTLPIMAHAFNYGNTSSMTVGTPSLSGFIEGVDQTITVRKSASATKTGVGTTEIPIFTIGNTATFGGVTNKATLNIDFASLATNVTAPSNTVQYRLLLGTSLTGQVSYTYSPVSAETSIVNVNTSATGIAGGTPILNLATTGSGNLTEDLSSYSIYLYPGQKLTLTALSSAASSSTVTGALSWKELF